MAGKQGKKNSKLGCGRLINIMTRRRRGPGFDWVIVKLGVPGKIKKIEVDTAHFKGMRVDVSEA